LTAPGSGLSGTDARGDVREDIRTSVPTRPRPNSRVTSRQIGQPSRSGSPPEPFKAAACNPGVMDGVLGIAVSEVILDEPQVVAAIGEVEAA
jgi:hypothetical protein